MNDILDKSNKLKLLLFVMTEMNVVIGSEFGIKVVQFLRICEETDFQNGINIVSPHEYTRGGYCG